MSSFDDRKRGEEAKFAHDASLRFRAEARRNKHLAHWAAAQLGLDGEGVANYVAEVIAADMAQAGTEDVVGKIKADFDAKGIAATEDDIRAKIAQFDGQAKAEILSEA